MQANHTIAEDDEGAELSTKSLILAAHSDTSLISELTDALLHLSEEEARELIGPLVEQFYALQFKLGGVVNKLICGSDQKIDYPPIPLGELRLVEAFIAVAENHLFDWREGFRALGWTKLFHMDKCLTEDNIEAVGKLARENDYPTFVKKVAFLRELGRKQWEAR